MQKVVEHGLKLDLHIHSYISSAQDMYGTMPLQSDHHMSRISGGDSLYAP